MLSRHLNLPRRQPEPRPRTALQLAQDERLREDWRQRRVSAPVEEVAHRWPRYRRKCYMAIRPERSEVGRIALIAWDAVAAYKRVSLKEPATTFADAPEPVRELFLRLIEMLVGNPGVNAAMLHRQWMLALGGQGWSFGEKLDVEAKKHPCLRDWRTLDETQRRKDELIVAVVQALTAFV